MLEDSGNRTKFESGAVRDIHTGKGRFDLVPLEYAHTMLESLSSVSSDIIFLISQFKKTKNIQFLQLAIRIFVRKEFLAESVLYDRFLELAQHYENGAMKYGEHNWEIGIPLHSFIDSAIRHLTKYYRGDADEPHGIAFIWNLLGACWTMEHKPGLDDFCE